MNRLTTTAIGVTAGLMLVATDGTTSLADEAAPNDERATVAESQPQQETPFQSGLVIVRDAETGELRAPTAEEWARLAPSLDPLNRSDAGLVKRHYSEGHVGVVLEGRFQSSMVLQRDFATGDIDPTCTHDAETAGKILTGAAAEEGTDEL